MTRRITLLSGGVGGAKLALGFYKLEPNPGLSIIANTGDDIEMFTLRICPDVDILLYTLADEIAKPRGWGVSGDSFRALERIRQLGGTDWFNLGDVDLGLHLFRAEALANGWDLSRIVAETARKLGVTCEILPMTEAYAPTYIQTNEGTLHLQEYMVRHKTEPVVHSIDLSAMTTVRPGRGVMEAIRKSDLLVVAPSNPLISIGPILAVPGIRQQLQRCKVPRVGISPIVGGKSLKGPSDTMLWQLGHEVSPVTVARMYQDILDVFVLDESDHGFQREIEKLGLRCLCLPTIMNSLADKKQLAQALLDELGG